MESPETQPQDKTSKFDGIADAMDVSTDIIKPPLAKPEVVETATKDQLKKDYEYTRGNLYSLIDKGQEAVDGILETIVINRRGTATVDGVDGDISGIPIIGDGTGGTATATVTNGVVSEIKLSNTNSSGYTYAHVRFVNGTWGGKKLVVGTLTDEPQFEVIIPPKGGHGGDIYRELGAFRVMVYSKFDNNVNDKTDYIVGNDFSRVGIVKDPTDLSGTSILNKRTATSLGALRLKVPDGSSTQLSNVVYEPNTKITPVSYTHLRAHET